METFNVPYIDGSKDQRHTLDLFLPSNSSNAPLVIYIHGGAWVSSSKDDFSHIGRTFMNHGISCIMLEYRLSPRTIPSDSSIHYVKHPDHVNDCKLALRWIGESASKYGYGTQCVYVGGHSVGALMAGLLICDKSYSYDGTLKSIEDGVLSFKGVFGLQGIYDLESLALDFPSYCPMFINSAVSTDMSIVQTCAPAYALRHIKKNELQAPKVPWTIIWSDQDELVNKRQSDEFVELLRSLNIPVHYYITHDDDPSLSSHDGVTTNAGFTKLIFPTLQNMINSTN